MAIAIAAVVTLYLTQRQFVASYVSKYDMQSEEMIRHPWLSFLNLDIFRRSSMRKVFREAKLQAKNMHKDGFKPTLIILIGRGGAIFGSLISYNMKNVPIFCVDRRYKWELTERKVTSVFSMCIPPKYLARVLLVAGEAHTGDTMKYFYDKVKSLYADTEIKTCVFFKQNICHVQIDYVGSTGNDQILLPWQDASFIRDSLNRAEAEKLDNSATEVIVDMSNNVAPDTD